MVKLGEVSPTIWDTITEKMEEELQQYKFKADDLAFDWRINAGSKKLEREIFQQYGVWKDIILHPTFQYVKTIAEENIDFDFQIGDPFIPTSTSVIILFMMHKRVKNSILFLIAGLLFNINPFYLFLIYIAWHMYNTNIKPKKYIDLKSTIKINPNELSGNCEPIKFNIQTFISECSSSSNTTVNNVNNATTGITYDHILIGNDISTFYCAALLSKVGHRCCVLQPAGMTPLEVQPDGAPCPVPLQNFSIGKVEKYQNLLDTVTVVNKNNKDRKKDPSKKYFHRTTFAPLGSEANGYMNCVVKVSSSSSSQQQQQQLVNTAASRSRIKKDRSWVLRAGENTVANEVSSVYGTDKPSTIQLFNALTASQQFLYGYLNSKVLSYKEWPALAKLEGVKGLYDLAQVSVAEFVSTALPGTEVHSPLTALAVYAAEEAVNGSQCSNLCLASAVNQIESGMFYPVGGPIALITQLICAIRSAGGEVYSDVPIDSVCCEGSTATKDLQAVGVKLKLSSSNCKQREKKDDDLKKVNSLDIDKNDDDDDDDDDENVIYCSKSVISGMGVLCTFLHLLPSGTDTTGSATSGDSLLTEATRESLAQLTEALPRVSVIFWIRGGSAQSLGLTNIDYMELSSGGSGSSGGGSTAAASLLNRNDVLAIASSSSSSLSQGYFRVSVPSAKDPSWALRYGEELHAVVVETEAPAAVVTAARHKYTSPPNNQPDFTTTTSATNLGPTLFQPAKLSSVVSSLSTAYVTTIASNNSSALDDIIRKCELKLLEIYPLVKEKIIHQYCVPLTVGGHRVSNSTAKYSAPLTATTDIPGLYLCGRDISTFGLAGDFQGGWVAANAVLGYTTAELQAGRNVVSDIVYVTK